MEMAKVEIRLPPISVIIAAFNEQAYLEATVVSILNSGFPCEVVVVDDGSTDRTPKILKKFSGRIKIVTHSTNKGKGAAMSSGLKAASGEIVIFCDAHLQGLRQDHLLSLVFPLIYGSDKSVLGVIVPEKISPSLVNVAPFLILTGQRAYYIADLLPLTDEMEDLGYGVETFLFAKFPKDRAALVSLPGLVHLIKTDTSSLVAATAGYLRESIEVIETLAKIQGIVPKELAESMQRVSALLSKYTGTRESNTK